MEYWQVGGGVPGRHHLVNILYLTGHAGEAESSQEVWEFALFGSPELCPVGFENPSSSWANAHLVRLPGHWQLQGFDVPIYTNTSYPFVFDPPFTRRTGDCVVTDCDAGLGGTTGTRNQISEKELGENTTGLYRKKFTLPRHWSFRKNRSFLVFEGVDSCIHIWLNGKYVGYSQDSCLPVEFEVSGLIDFSSDAAEQTLVCQVKVRDDNRQS